MLRASIRDHHWLALALVLAALVMKALVPGGYMVTAQGKTITVELCGDSIAGHLTAQVTIPMKGDGAHGKGEGTCPYSTLAQASLGGADPLLLALALAYVLALGFLPLALPSIQRFTYLRPPPRGPPALA